MRPAAFAAVARGGEYKARRDKCVGFAVSFAKCTDLVESGGEAGFVADDAGACFHKPAKLRARRVSEDWGEGGGFRRAGGLSWTIAQPRSDSLREHHRLQQ